MTRLGTTRLNRRAAVMLLGAGVALAPSLSEGIAPATGVQEDFLRVVPGVRVGPVGPTSTLESLRNALGTVRVMVRDIPIGEGLTEPGVVLFPDDSTRRAYVYWRDTLRFSSQAAVVIRDSGTVWQFPHGITIGTSLAELERLNGRPFAFGGFGWDYGGGISSWGHGALDGLLRPGFELGLTLTPRCDPQLTAVDQRAVFGDVTIGSSNPVAQAMCPVVDELRITFSP